MAIGIIYTITDEKGTTSTTQVNIPSGTSIVDIVAFGQGMAALIDSLVAGRISRIGAVIDIALPGGIKLSALANSDVEEGARAQFQTALDNFTAMRLPTFDETFILAGSRAVDQTDPDVAAYLAAMVTGIDTTGAGGSGIIQPCDTRGEDVVVTTSFVEQFQSSRN